MSHDVVLLARAPLPPRAGGYHGGWGPSPLWYAAVTLRVEPFDAVRHEPLAQQVPASMGPFVQVIHVSYATAAAEHAVGYVEVLRDATGAVRFDEGRFDGEAPSAPTAPILGALEHALFRADVEALSFLEEPPEPWEQALEPDEFLERFGRECPTVPLLQDVLLVRPGKLEAVEALVSRHTMPVRVTTLSAWVREEPTRLSVVAARCPGEALRALTHVVLPAGDALPEKVLFALLPHALPLEG